MKRSEFIRKCGPYKVHSISQDMHGVRLEVFPAFPQYDKDFSDGTKWAINRLKEHKGGGPSIFTAIALAKELEAFLNQSYSEAEVEEWKKTLAKALEKINKQNQKRFEKAMAKLEQEVPK